MIEKQKMLEFKRPGRFPEPQPRWEVGADRRHVAAYVAMALIAGFALGFVAAKFIGIGNVPAKKAPNDLRAGSATEQGSSQSGAGFSLIPPNEYRKVAGVTHADTIQLEGAGSVRMLGVETPDRKSPEDSSADQAKSSIAFTKDALLGKEVRLEYDPALDSAGNKDSAGDILAYVYTQDGTLFNAEMIKQGMAFARVTEPFKRLEEFRSYEREAMESMRGVWGPPGGANASASAPAADSTRPASRTADEAKSRKLTPLLPSDLDGRSSSSPTLGVPAPGEVMVYVSAADHMYHKSGCEYLDKKNHAMGLSEAKAAGYVACGRCFASTVMKAP